MKSSSKLPVLYLLSLGLFLILGFFGLVSTAEAQGNSSCAVSDVVLDPAGNQFNAYDSPFAVNLTARLSNCEGATVRLNIWAEMGTSDVLLDSGSYTVPASSDLVEIDHTILSMGEPLCMNGRSPQCQFYVTFERTDIGPLLLHSSAGVPLSTTRRDVLGYNCDGLCNDPMSSLGNFPSSVNILQSSYALTVTSADPNEGNVQGSGTYPIGQLASVVASPVQGYFFDYWEEGGQSISKDRAIQVLMNANRSLTAYFTTTTPALVGTSGSGASLVTGECTIGPVQFTPFGNLLFAAPGPVTLQWLATDCYGKTIEFSIGAKSATQAAPIQAYARKITLDDAFFGGSYSQNNDIVEFTVTNLNLDGTPCDPNLFPSCQYFFEAKDVTNPGVLNVLYTSRNDTLRSTGRDVLGFECSGNCGTNLNVKNLPFVTKILAKEYPLDITIEVLGGFGASTTAGMVSGDGLYPINSNANLVATPNPGFSFDHWQDEAGTKYTAPRIFVTVDKERSIIARFRSNNLRTVSVALSGTGTGTIIGGNTIQIPANAGFEFVVQPAAGSRVVAWRTAQGEVIGRANSLLVNYVEDNTGALVARVNGITLPSLSPTGPVSLQLELEQFDAIGLTPSSTSLGFYLVPCGDSEKTPIIDADGDGQLDDPSECSYDYLIIMISRIINFIFILILPLAGVVAVVTGVVLLTSGGNTAKYGRVKQAFGKFIIGIIVVMVAWLLVATVLRVLGVKDAYSLLAVTGLL